MKEPIKTVGGLYQWNNALAKIIESNRPKFCFVSGDKTHYQFLLKNRLYRIDCEDLLMLIDPDINLTQKLLTYHTAPGWACSAWASWASWSPTPPSDYQLANQQWEKDKCIPGSVFLTPDGKNIWISDIDFKYFKKVEL